MYLALLDVTKVNNERRKLGEQVQFRTTTIPITLSQGGRPALDSADRRRSHTSPWVRRMAEEVKSFSNIQLPYNQSK